MAFGRVPKASVDLQVWGGSGVAEVMGNGKIVMK